MIPKSVAGQAAKGCTLLKAFLVRFPAQKIRKYVRAEKF